jgi:hypothetical protein
VSEEITMQEWDEYFIKLLERRNDKGEAETEMKKKQKRHRKQKSRSGQKNAREECKRN